MTALLGGLRADELCQVDVGDIRTTADGSAVIHVKGKGGKERAFPLRLNCFRLLRPILTAVPSGYPPLLNEKRMRRARPYRNGLCDRHRSSAATANASPVERCSRALNGHSNVLDLTPSPFPVPWFTACGTPTRQNSPVPMSASTPQ